MKSNCMSSPAIASLTQYCFYNSSMWRQLAMAYAYSPRNSILWYEYTTTYLSSFGSMTLKMSAGFSAINNNVSENMLSCVSWSTCPGVSLCSTSRGGIAGSEAVFVFNFIKWCQIVFQRGCTHYHSASRPSVPSGPTSSPIELHIFLSSFPAQ